MFKKLHQKLKLKTLSTFGRFSPAGICFKKYCESILNNTLKEKDKIEAYEKEIEHYEQVLQNSMKGTFEKFPEVKRILVCAGIYEVLNTIPEEKILY